jgi:HD superfamily phosphohydrolase
MTAPLKGEQHELSNRIRCPVHGFVRYSQAEREIIDHPHFQRLRRIKQLAFTDYVYPGATHTRFEHTLGVLELSTRAFDVIARKKKQILQDKLQTIPGLTDDTLPRCLHLVRLHALFHDIGHTPYSHAGELLEINHEKRAIEIAQQFAPVMETAFFPGCSSLLAQLLGQVPSANQPLTVLQKIINGQLDMDRADYLLRDSHHCGVEYGRYDQLRMIESLNVAEDQQGMLDMAIDSDGFHSVEALLLARYQMTLQVYFHRVRRIFDYYLKCAVDALVSQDRQLTVQTYGDMDDGELFEMLRRAAAQPKMAAHPWAKRLVARHHHRCVWEKGDHADTKDLKAARGLLQQAIQTFPSWHFYLDEDARGSVHNLYVPGLPVSEDRQPEDILVLDIKTGQKGVSIGERSKILDKIPRTFHVLRVYAAPRNGDATDPDSKAGLREIKNWCLNYGR